MDRRGFQHVKPGKGGAFVRTKLKNVLSGKVVDRTFNAGVKVDTATVDKRTMQYLYKDGTDWVFMDTGTFDQIPVKRDGGRRGGQVPLETRRQWSRCNEGNPLYYRVARPVELVVEYTEPGLQGDRSTGGTKPARLETGRRSQCRCSQRWGAHPVDTRDGPTRSCLSRGRRGRFAHERPRQGAQAGAGCALRG